VQEAERLAVMFTKDGNQIDSLHEMQCMWYETEAGRAWLHRKDYGQVRPLACLRNCVIRKKVFQHLVASIQLVANVTATAVCKIR
jgi:hypothetical protein